MVVQTANRLLQGGAQHEQPKWTAEQIHGKVCGRSGLECSLDGGGGGGGYGSLCISFC